jgi:hypothetical protein
MTVFAQDAPEGNRQENRTESVPAPDEIIVDQWELNRRESARVTLALYRGVWLINVRKWFLSDGDELRPGKGFAIGVKHLPLLAGAVTQALAVARDRGLVPPDDVGDARPRP